MHHRLFPLGQSLRSGSGSHPDSPPREQEAGPAPHHSGHGWNSLQNTPSVSATRQPVSQRWVAPGAEPWRSLRSVLHVCAVEVSSLSLVLRFQGKSEPSVRLHSWPSALGNHSQRDGPLVGCGGADQQLQNSEGLTGSRFSVVDGGQSNGDFHCKRAGRKQA